jgi:hypothetical protein
MKRHRVGTDHIILKKHVLKQTALDEPFAWKILLVICSESTMSVMEYFHSITSNDRHFFGDRAWFCLRSREIRPLRLSVVSQQ